MAAGFLFTLGSFVEEVPYDPRMYFLGEEQNLVMRAFTRGWRIWHPQHPLIPIQHLYKMPHQEHRTHHWHKDYEAERTIKWPILKQSAVKRLAELVYQRSLLGVYGLGMVRTLEDFYRLSGIDYQNKLISR